jgi:anthranilate synthase component 1
MEMTYEQYLELAKTHRIVPVYKIVDEDMLTPIGIFDKLSAYQPSYILESIGDPKNLGRYSFVGLDSDLITGGEGGLDYGGLDALLSKYKGPELDVLPTCYASIIGYMAYNAIEDIHPLKLNKTSSIPKYQFMFSRTVVVIDHLKHQLILIYNVENPKAKEYRRAIGVLNQIYEALVAEKSLSASKSQGGGPLVFESNFAKEDYVAAVNKAKSYIEAGDIFQVVLSQKFTARGTLDGFSLYRNLRKENPSPYLSYIRFKTIEVLCSSPEMLVRLDGTTVETAPIAGTRAVKDDGKDHLRAEELLNDEKDIAEHLMLVDLGRNDIGKISKPGTVTVAEYCQAKYFSKVMHLVSSVKGQPSEGVSGLDALKATFPAGTVSGAPKLRAMEIIEELEPDSRDLYAGTIVLMNPSGHLNSCISIRTIQLLEDQVVVQAGGGIVYDSNPDHEFLEVLNKSRAMFNAIEKTNKGGITYDFDYR